MKNSNFFHHFSGDSESDNSVGGDDNDDDDNDTSAEDDSLVDAEDTDPTFSGFSKTPTATEPLSPKPSIKSMNKCLFTYYSMGVFISTLLNQKSSKEKL